MPFTFEKEPHAPKDRSADRILTLEVMEGKNPRNSTGLIDTRLFKGGNRLHAIIDETGLWCLKYDEGIIPPGLRDRFTSFLKLKEHATTYFADMNVNIKEVID